MFYFFIVTAIQKVVNLPKMPFEGNLSAWLDNWYFSTEIANRGVCSFPQTQVVPDENEKSFQKFVS